MALGEAAYAIAMADGKVQKEEQEKFERVLKYEFAKHGLDFDYAEIIFKVLKKDVMEPQTAYTWCLREMRLNSQYVSKRMKEKFVEVIKEVAAAFPPITKQERAYIDDFIYQLKEINGDPVFNKESGI
jgi:tellurite resistance protein